LVHAGARPRNQLSQVAIRPPRALGVITGGALAAWAFLLAAAAAYVAAGSPVQLKTFLAWAVFALLLLVGVLFAYWAWAVFTLGYEIGRDALTIRWGFRRVHVPIANIQRMIPGRTVYEARVEGLNWWGCHIGHGEVTRVGYTLFYSTHSSPDEILYVVTGGEAFGLTVLDQAAFAEDVQANAALGAIIGHTQRAAAWNVAAWPFWRDATAKSLAMLSVLAAAVVTGYVYAEYPGLPSVVQLDFPALDGIVRIGEKSELLRIAYASGTIALANSVLGVIVHSRVRAAGLWLFASGILLQGILFAAAVVAFARA
jgi:hypothetical protein